MTLNPTTKVFRINFQRWRHPIRYFFIMILLLPSMLHSTDIFIQIQRGNKVTIGFPEFVSKNDPDNKALAGLLQAVTKNDILFSQLFNLSEEGPAVGGGKIDFAEWAKLGSDILITGNANFKDPETVQLIASVYELPSGNPIFQKTYKTARSNARQMAHQFVADLLFRFTGHAGVSRSKIAFCNNASGAKELYLIDYDGENLRRITNDKSVALLPRWSPQGGDIIYTTYRGGNPDLYLYSTDKGKSKVVSLRQGLNSCASFSPDGKQIVLTLSFEGEPNLYLLDLQGKIVRRLTKMKAADTSPSYSPDGRRIVFTSDRPGWPQIYAMDIDGSNVERLTESGYCDAAVWSPAGDKIAYSKSTTKGKHDIFVQDLNSGQVQQITTEGSNENPSFSPDGRYLIFSSTRNKKRELFIASLDGTIQKKLGNIPGDCYTPSWGP